MNKEAREIIRKANPPTGLVSKTKTLAYSTLSDKVYWLDGKGQKHDVTDNFIHVMMLWLAQENNSFIEKDTRYIRHLSYDNIPHWELSLKKLK